VQDNLTSQRPCVTKLYRGQHDSWWQGTLDIPVSFYSDHWRVFPFAWLQHVTICGVYCTSFASKAPVLLFWQEFGKWLASSGDKTVDA
jgi:hypothetical protein